MFSIPTGSKKTKQNKKPNMSHMFQDQNKPQI